MKEKNFKYIYGPVWSWRLGISLGIDLVFSRRKLCNFNCIYCQLGETTFFTTQPRIYVPTHLVIQELKNLPKMKLDYITFSGTGEPTLAKNLGRVIDFIKDNFRTPIAVLTNSSFLNNPIVIKELSLVDFVCAKLDAATHDKFLRVNRPARCTDFKDILEGLIKFRQEFKKRFALQIMFVDENKSQAQELAEVSYRLMPDEIQINTPLRPSPIRPLSKQQIEKIKEIFLKKFNLFPEVKIISVYDRRQTKSVKVLSKENTELRRPVLCSEV